VFHADRWAAAFINSAGTDAGAELERLKALLTPLKPVSKSLFGLSAAKRLEDLLRHNTGADFEMTIRFISLLVSKNRFRRIDSIIAGIEKRLDEQNGVLDVTVEASSAIDSAAEDALKKMIRERTGAAAINMKIKTVPELIAGYRLWVGGLCIDASLRGQLEHMTEDLLGRQSAVGAAFLHSAGGY